MSDHYVYIKDKSFHWIPGLLVDQDRVSATVAVANYESEQEITGNTDHDKTTSRRTVQLKDYTNNALPLQNVVDGRVKLVEDMIELSFLHEAAILYNLKARHVKSKPYTRTGDIVIAVNPYKWFPSLYTESNRTRYSRALVWEANRKNYDPRQDLSPHVYETSALAYKGLSTSGVHQSILVSGESGAGKTETVKICMNHLASVVQQEHQQDADPAQDQHVITKILDSNPLLEAFGNAKTRRNDNSSRFGKFVRLQFERGLHNPCHLTLLGSACQVYLLEKSRVVMHDDEERTFHIFYQLLAAPDKVKSKFWRNLEGCSSVSFAYVGETSTHSIEGVSDADQFKKTLQSLSIIGIEGALLREFVQALCVVLQLGNIRFGPNPKDSDHSTIQSKQELIDLAELMGISEQNLEQTLTQRIVKVRNEETSVPLNHEAAKDSIDALAKQVYNRVFLWLVKTINDSTVAGEEEADHYGIIGLLDIFGFESFPVNSFEQLSINYANERLQQKFTRDVFVSVFEEYKEEGIALDEIKYDDNTHVLDLIQNRTGLLAMLNEECIRPNGSDFGFVNKAVHANKKSPALFVPRIVHSKVEFGIRHYAGDVVYDATDFVTKNQDTLPSDLLECACTSRNKIIARELLSGVVPSKGSSQGKNRPPTRKSSNLVAPTVWTKYKGQLSLLMKNLQDTQSRYIRCIKPNSVKKGVLMEHELTLKQLRSSGVISAVTLARSAFPNRLEHALVLDRFYMLWPPSEVRHVESDSKSKRIASKVLLSWALRSLEYENVKAFVIGNSRAYFRAGALEFLEASRLRGMELPATVIQAMFRGFSARRRVYRLKYKSEMERQEIMEPRALTIQCAWRCFAARKIAYKIRKLEKAKARKAREKRRRLRAAIQIQTSARGFLARNERGRRYVQHIKKEARMLKKEKKLKKMAKAATVIQRYVRRASTRRGYSKVVDKLRERNKIKEKVEKIKKKIAKAEKARRKELEKAQANVESERAGREAWEESVLAATTEAAQSETAKMVEFLQGEHRKLQIRTKALDDMVKPLQKKFELLMEENQDLRKEFADIHNKNETMKLSNRELVERRNAAEKNAKDLKDDLKVMSNRFIPVAHGRMDFQRALKEILEMLESRCRDDQLVEDVTLLAYQCQADANTMQAGVDAAQETDVELSPKPNTLGGSFSNVAAPKTPLSMQSPISSTSRRRKVPGGLSGIGSPNLDVLASPVGKNPSSETKSKKNKKKSAS